MSIQGSINAILSSLERPALAKLAGQNAGREISSAMPEEKPPEQMEQKTKKILTQTPEEVAKISEKVSDARMKIATAEKKRTSKKIQERERKLRGEAARQEAKEGRYERWESLR